MFFGLQHIPFLPNGALSGVFRAALLLLMFHSFNLCLSFSKKYTAGWGFPSDEKAYDNFSMIIIHWYIHTVWCSNVNGGAWWGVDGGGGGRKRDVGWGWRQQEQTAGEKKREEEKRWGDGVVARKKIKYGSNTIWKFRWTSFILKQLREKNNSFTNW